MLKSSLQILSLQTIIIFNYVDISMHGHSEIFIFLQFTCLQIHCVFLEMLSSHFVKLIIFQWNILFQIIACVLRKLNLCSSKCFLQNFINFQNSKPQFCYRLFELFIILRRQAMFQAKTSDIKISVLSIIRYEVQTFTA